VNNQLPAKVSDVFDPSRWRTVSGFDDFKDMTYHRQVERSTDGTVKDLPTVRIAFNRPEVRNAFRPGTVDELYRAMDHARMTPDVATVLLTGNGPSEKDGGHSFCSGGDQRIRGRDGYRYAEGDTQETIDPARAGSLHILEVQRLMRTMPKVVIAVVNGWAAGGGHSLHVVSDLTIASREHGKFKQTDATVGSFDAGYGSALLARQIGQKAAREIFFLAREYSAEDMVRYGRCERSRGPLNGWRTWPWSTPRTSPANHRRPSECSSSLSTWPTTDSPGSRSSPEKPPALPT
jgi:naphthoate synthase